MISAKILAHTKNLYSGDELITFECTYHRFILPEVNTHRMISKNSASSRGIPISKRIQMVQDNPAFPVEWGQNQRGMVAQSLVSKETEEEARRIWLEASKSAIEYAEKLNKLNIHKQLANRVLEPFCWQTSVFTGMRKWFEHMFNQRIHPDAQPEFRELAVKMSEALQNSTPKTKVVHLPYILPDEETLSTSIKAMVSVARCARVSYTPFNEETADLEKDIDLFFRLYRADPPHLSPFEHIAIVDESSSENYFNLNGFVSFRWMIENMGQDVDFESIFDNLPEGYKWFE